MSTQPVSPPSSQSTVATAHSIATGSNSNGQSSAPIVIDVDQSDIDDDVIFVKDLQTAKFAASNIIEVDTDDENLSLQALDAIANQYKEDDSDIAAMTTIRPWIKDDTARKSRIHVITQFTFYKCMLAMCHFGTNSSKLFRKHMEMHEQVIKHFENYNLLGDGMRLEKLLTFRECPYCRHKSESNEQLLEHMENVHSASILQCAHCFYRSIEVDYMILHRNVHHPNSTEAILLCGKKREFQSRDKDILRNAAQNVRKISCGQSRGR